MDALKSLIIAIVSSLALTSCLSKGESKNKEEKYNAIEAEINNSENNQEAADKNEKLVVSALEDALKENDFVYANKYCDLLKSINHIESDKYIEKIKDIETAVLKDSLNMALRNKNFEKAKKLCSKLETVRYSEAEKINIEIKKAESTFLIIQNSEDAADRLISSIDTRPTEKPAIGKESESTPAYDWQSKRHNKRINRYLDQALENKNDILAQKLLTQYVEEIIFTSVTKKKENGSEYRVNVVSGYSDEPMREAAKRYEEAKKLW